MKEFTTRRLVSILCAAGLLSATTDAMASAFQIWEQDGASVGNYHAGYAAEANDASIAFYNPAGITRIKNQQAIFGTAAINSEFEYKGNIGITENSIPGPVTVTIDNVKADGGAFSLVPSLGYVAPINDWIGFGFSVVAPFGLMTDYGSSTALRYAATKTSISVIDISPSLGFKVTDKASLGVGFDVQSAEAEFNSVAGLVNLPPPLTDRFIDTRFDTKSSNKASDTGYGYHLGAMYEFTPETRVGISYHSQVSHHFTGKSKFVGPLADLFNEDEPLISRDAKTNVTLPAYTAVSAFSRIKPCFAIMGTVVYTQWNKFDTLTLQNVAGLVDNEETAPLPGPSKTIEVSIPEKYQNTWNVSLGANYYPTETITIRTGIGYDETPVQNKYRNVQLPDNDRYAVALGAHYQATKTIGLDVGYTHIFFDEVKVNPPAQVNGAEVVSTNGHVNGGADVFSGQVTWDIV